jgi:hypothetical protein
MQEFDNKAIRIKHQPSPPSPSKKECKRSGGIQELVETGEDMRLKIIGYNALIISLRNALFHGI